MKRKSIAITLLAIVLIPFITQANTCFWAGRMSASGQDDLEPFDYEEGFAGFTNVFTSDVVKQGFAKQIGMIILNTNDAAARTSFKIDPLERRLHVYSYAEVNDNPTQDTYAGADVALRDYYLADGSGTLSIEVKYSFSDRYSTAQYGNASIGVFAQAYNTDGQVYNFHNGYENIAEGMFFTSTDDALPYDNMLDYQSAYGELAQGSGTGLQNFSLTFDVEPGDLIAIDTLTGAFTAAGGYNNTQITGQAYAGTMDGFFPSTSGGGGGAVTTSSEPYYAHYTVEVTSGSGTFLPYSYTPPVPEPAGKLEQGTSPNQLNLVLAGEDGITYQVDTSTNLVDWSTWTYETGRGSSIEKPLDISGTNACFYRITPIKK